MAIVSPTGSGQVNAGNIILRIAGVGTVLGLIPAGYGIWQTAVFSVPIGLSLYLDSISGTLNRTGTGWAELSFESRIAMTSGSWLHLGNATVSASSPFSQFVQGRLSVAIGSGTDIRLRCTAASTDGLGISAFATFVARAQVAS